MKSILLRINTEQNFIRSIEEDSYTYNSQCDLYLDLIFSDICQFRILNDAHAPSVNLNSYLSIITDPFRSSDTA